MPTKSKTPVVSFGPKLLAALLKAARQEVRFEFPNEPRKAVRLAFRFNQLRQAMRAEKHEFADKVYRVKVLAHLTPQGKPTGVLTLTPKDSEFDEAFDAAGVELPDIVNEPSLIIVDESKSKKGQKEKVEDRLPWDIGEY